MKTNWIVPYCEKWPVSFVTNSWSAFSHASSRSMISKCCFSAISSVIWLILRKDFIAASLIFKLCGVGVNQNNFVDSFRHEKRFTFRKWFRHFLRPFPNWSNWSRLAKPPCANFRLNGIDVIIHREVSLIQDTYWFMSDKQQLVMMTSKLGRFGMVVRKFKHCSTLSLNNVGMKTK